MPRSTFATVKSSLGDDALFLARMSGQEALGRLFTLELDLFSEDDQIAFADVVGQPMTVELEAADDTKRYWNGVVSRFGRLGESGRYVLYRATLRPWMWLLTRSMDSRIFQRMKAPDVIKEVFRNHGFSDFEEALSGSYRTWEYLVQYRESAFNFVSRLMEQEGIYYYFKHEAGKHTLVLSDSYGSHHKTPSYARIPYYPPQPGERRERDHLDGMRVMQELQAGSYMLNDFDFKAPKAALGARRKAAKNKGEFEVYDYPGGYVALAEGESYTRARIEQLTSQYEQIEAQGGVRGAAVGALFELENFPREDQNREYLITQATYSLDVGAYESTTMATGEPMFRCMLTAIDSHTPFRPARETPKPEITGPQTALVVGPSGDEIHTDRYGRVKVQFHWDRVGEKNEESSCWVRVAQVWAGTRWGAMHIPRIGQEVIVDFLEGDPDRPIITGRVYNADNMPPYELPANKTQSGIKSRSSKGGESSNFNELRFEDKKGEEQLYMQAEKNMDTLVKADQTLTVGGNRTKLVSMDEKSDILQNRTEAVTLNETIDIGGNRKETVIGSETLNITGPRTETLLASETITIAGPRTEAVNGPETIGINNSRTTTIAAADVLIVGAGYTLKVTGAGIVSTSGAHNVTVGAGQSVSVSADDSFKAGGSQSIAVGKARSQNIGTDDSLKVKNTLTIDAGDKVVLKSGKASITLTKSGDIEISGKNIAIKGSGKINAKASSDVVIKGSKIGQN